VANEIKFGYTSGLSLCFTVFDKNGNFRTIEHIPLYELKDTGYYTGTAPVDLTTGDIILAYELEPVTYDSAGLYVGTYEFVYYESSQVFYEGYEVFWYDSAVVDIVTWTGDPVGSGEYVSQADIVAYLISISTGQTTTTSDADTSFLAVREALARALENKDIGYYELRP
jgi:hypothetical protein